MNVPYVALAALILAVLGLIAFLIGLAAGRRTRNSERTGKRLLIVCVALIGVLLTGSHFLPITGPVITQQTLAFALELSGGLFGGYIVGVSRLLKPQDMLRPAGGASLVVMLVMIGIQTRNTQRVIETAQEAGYLRPRAETAQISDNKDAKPESGQACRNNLTALYNAFEQYVSFTDALPPATTWETDSDFTSRVPSDDMLHCPAVSTGHDDRWGYAYNDALAGKKLNLNGKPLKTLPNAAKMPLLYDSSNLAKNAHDAFTSPPKPGRHAGRNSVLYLDGHVE